MSLATWMLKEFVTHKYFDIALDGITDIANQIARDTGYSEIVRMVKTAKQQVHENMARLRESTTDQLAKLAAKLKADIEQRYKDSVIQDIMLRKLDNAVNAYTASFNTKLQEIEDTALTDINRAADKAVLSLPSASSTLPSIIKATPDGGYFIDFGGD